ncbi:HBL139Cp [Eremothecium sinecaudum]|uniref:HBL139Cp n=1 Tax=Eremothecium sinecaudum TaxID=45286 RepID=A0A109UWC6_9SACH|nr:HBL139Cp [Eremothecium sinecaudum]AMD18763.1 HBL139Cp [Eremothecium sinecaudum]
MDAFFGSDDYELDDTILNDPSGFILDGISWRFYYSHSKIITVKLIEVISTIYEASSEVKYKESVNAVYITIVPHDSSKPCWYLFLYNSCVIVTSNVEIMTGENGNLWEEVNSFPFEVNFSARMMRRVVDSVSPFCRSLMRVSFQVKEMTKHLEKFDIEVDIDDLKNKDDEQPFNKILMNHLHEQIGLEPTMPINHIKIPKSLLLTSKYVRFIGFSCLLGTSAVAAIVADEMSE